MTETTNWRQDAINLSNKAEMNVMKAADYTAGLCVATYNSVQILASGKGESFLTKPVNEGLALFFDNDFFGHADPSLVRMATTFGSLLLTGLFAMNVADKFMKADQSKVACRVLIKEKRNPS